MKKFMLLLAMVLPFQAFAAVQSTYSVVITAISYEGDLLKVETQNNLSTGCAINDENNALWVEASALQKVIAGVSLSAQQDRRQAILYYEGGSCGANGVEVVGAALKADPNDSGAPEVHAIEYGLISQKNLGSNQVYTNNTASSQRVIFTGMESTVRSNNSQCDFSYYLIDSKGTHEIKSVNRDAGTCNVAQVSVNLAPKMSFKFIDRVLPSAKQHILVFGVK